ncbi:MAG: iron-sulfur cluster assembly scaffold protein [Blastocatellia bacterium]|nr:iron-sulfur cluster assembly scaffold protein [Blastocatellia bacterium]
MPYSKTVLDHLENPRNVGELADATVTSSVINSACGDQIKLFIKLDKNITSVKMQAYGCAPTLASASLLTEWLIDKTIHQASLLETDELIKMLEGLPRGKKHAADLAIEALQTALSKLNK